MLTAIDLKQLNEMLNRECTHQVSEEELRSVATMFNIHERDLQPFTLDQLFHYRRHRHAFCLVLREKFPNALIFQIFMAEDITGIVLGIATVEKTESRKSIECWDYFINRLEELTNQ